MDGASELATGEDPLRTGSANRRPESHPRQRQPQADGYNAPPMRLLLQQRPVAGESPKYVQLILQQDLLGGWSLLREAGQTGGKATLKREQFLDQSAALAAFEKARDAQLKRGFQVMFAQGATAPQ